MIVFKSVTYKNFLSTGNAGTTVKLNENQTTLIQGVSGAGKSTMIDALCFGLYGKPFRDINKPQIVNSVNGKKCEVTVEFRIGEIDYKVVRGVKPAKFEIYANDKLINQDAALKDYQKVLEQQILGMSFKTFTQISILGSTAYTPFMELSAAGRREVIEDILDIGIFSTMNQLLKVQIQETKEVQVQTDAELRTQKGQAEVLQKLVNVLSNKQNSELDEIRVGIEKITNEIDVLERELSLLEKNTIPLKKRTEALKSLIETSNTLLEVISVKNAEWEQLDSHIRFFGENDNCPTCYQSIDAAHKAEKVQVLALAAADIEQVIQEQTEARKKIRNRMDTISKIAEDVQANNQRMLAIKSSISLLQSRQIEELTKLEEKSEVSADIVDAKRDLKTAAKLVLSLIDKKKELATQRELQEAASMLLKDSGIKTAIIREYLPLINKLLNKYLNDMELFVEFHLDESFNEVIKSRHRDEFTYGNFSEGEKMRISLALMFTWRHIAKLKNSASCNLLILDEILVGRLDQANSDIVINLINQISKDGTNVFAISHGDALADKFSGVLTFEKQGDFSVMV
jgi:DNA repair exonuclease SbcCD ATPase subunit